MSNRRERRQRGATLIELIVSIVIVSIALSSILLAFGRLNRGSVDPMIQTQAQAIAESYLEEILRREAAACTSSGYTERDRFRHVMDYNGLSEAPTDMYGEPIVELAAYRVEVRVEGCLPLGPAGATVPAARVIVEVANGDYRTRFYGYRADY
ncbi:hypothetical protein CAI21_13315 [Alkalilimnicola ehrlichii]|uniref:MSHA pilin protein MshD n=1 Tax=Alkalilimnicola ehrlichii TaxID=351052 RepID=A0A3E0WPH7_9GAMM|nr:type II secretion system protein [Alkalilimnicola ehrlichii]RFA28289.1 hypothetical protein CAI21_13315 [Alkalilimnicola ehrlichii]RFA34890.1 hypothetical protein CAL65_14450 [Alkalilimnicola ehrlichii]